MIDVAVIGSGIIGLACARALSKRGRKVAVFDAAPGRSAAHAAAGMLGPWAEHPEEASSLDMRERALSLYPGWIEAIEEETGRHPDFEISGTLVLDDDEGSAGTRLREVMDRAPDARTVTPEEIGDVAPDVSGDAVCRGGVQLPSEGYVDPRTLIDALRGSKAYGIEFRDEEVLALRIESGRVRGVTTASGVTESRHVVNATGAWAASFLPGIRIRPMRGELVVLRPPGDPLRGRGVIRSGSIYIVPRRDASVIVGGTTADAGFEARVTAEGVEGILRGAFEIIPVLRGWEVVEVRAGLRPFLDSGPWIGKEPEREGLVHAIGMNRHGILLAPLAAERVLQEIEG